jgi:hypothetical protein
MRSRAKTIKKAGRRVAQAAGAAVSGARRRVRRAVARRKLKKVVRQTKDTLAVAGKAAVVAGLAAGAQAAVREIRRRRGGA